MSWTNNKPARTASSEGKQWSLNVRRRDGYKCVLCGYQGTPGHADVEADHVIPVFEGGAQHSLSNGRTLCVPCHKVKTAEESARARAAKGRLLPPEAHPNTVPVQTTLTYLAPWDDPTRMTTDPRISAYGPSGKP